MWSVPRSGSALLERSIISFTLSSFLVSTAALVDRKIRGLARRPNVSVCTSFTGTNDVKADVTDYVAVIAMMPPAAPAKEWIAESLGIVEEVIWCNAIHGSPAQM